MQQGRADSQGRPPAASRAGGEAAPAAAVAAVALVRVGHCGPLDCPPYRHLNAHATCHQPRARIAQMCLRSRLARHHSLPARWIRDAARQYVMYGCAMVCRRSDGLVLLQAGCMTALEAMAMTLAHMGAGMWSTRAPMLTRTASSCALQAQQPV